MLSIIYQYILSFFLGTPKRETRDESPKLLFDTFKGSLVPFFNQFGNFDFIGAFEKLESIEISHPSTKKTLVDFIYRTIAKQIVTIEFQSSRNASYVEHYLTKTMNIRYINNYEVTVVPFVVFLPLIGGGEKKIEEQIKNYFAKTQYTFTPYYIYISDLKPKIDEILARIANNINNFIPVDDTDLFNLCFFPTLYSDLDDFNDLNNILDISYKAFNLLDDADKKKSCLTNFFSFLKFYCPKYCEYLPSHLGENKMNLLCEYLEDVVAKPLKSELSQAYAVISLKDAVISQKDVALSQKEEALSQKDAVISQKDVALSQKDAVISQKDVAISQKDEALSQKDSIIHNCAKRLLKQGVAKEIVANETNLPLEKVEELSLELKNIN
jgi:hypothetical protein